MSILKKLTIFFIVLGIIFGYGLVADNSFSVNGATLEPAPTPTPTYGPIATAPPPLKLQFYNGNISPVCNMIVMNYKIINPGKTALSLSDVKVRYWYTSDGEMTQQLFIYYSSIGTANITGFIAKMTKPKVGADHYAEISFATAAGSLAPGGSIEIMACIAKADWTNFIQTNDYSFNPTATTYVDWTKVTGYISGVLQWGMEP
jgi:hypothetical protein